MKRLRDTLSPVFHLAFLVHHFIVIGYSHKIHETVQQMDSQNLDQRIVDMKNFGSIFFTNWNLIIQTAYFFLAIIDDIVTIFGSNQALKQKLDARKGFLFTSFVFPCSLFVSTIFWSVYLINREWVLPEVLDEYVPKWLNHAVHTNVTIFLVVEVLLANQLLPSFKTAFVALTILTFIYDTIFFVAYFISGRWAYGLFYVLNWPERIFLVLFNYCLSILIMRIGLTIENFKYTVTKKQKIN